MNRIQLNIQKFADGKVTIETEIDVNGVKVGIKQIQQQAKEAGDSTSRLGDIIKGNLISSAIQKGIGTVVSGIKNINGAISDLVVSGGFDRAINIENAEFKLKGLGHSAEDVDAIMKNALASVKGTAYGLDEAATIAASAVAAGVKPGEDLERTLKLVADAAAISGRDMQSMGAIFNKVAAAGKLTGQELNQLTDSGIPVLQLLGDSMGKTTEEIQDMVSAGEIGFDEFRNAIEKGMGGAALTLGQTFEGAVSNTKAAASRLGASFMKPFTESLTPALGTITTLIDDIASGTVDNIDETINTLGEQIETGIFGLIDNLEPILNNFLKVIEELLPKILQIIQDSLPYLMPVIKNVIITITKILIDNLPMILNTGIQIILELIIGIAEALPELIPAIVDAVILMVETLIDNIDLIIDAGIQLIIGLAEGLIEALPKLIDKIPVIIDKLITAITNNLPKIIEMGITLIIKLAEGLIKAIPQLVSKIPQIIAALVKGFANALGSVVEIGKNLVKGIWNGISDALGWILDKIKGFGSAVLDGIKSIFGIHSPSTVMRDEVGKYLAEGIGVGFEDELNNVYKDMQNAIDLETSKMNANIETSGTYQMAMTGLPTFNLLDNTENTTQLVVNGKVLAEVVNTENRNREVATA